MTDSPIFCSIDITTACNLGCVYCYKRDIQKQNPGPLGLEDLFFFARQVLESFDGPIVFQFHGGEPLIEFEKITRFVEGIKDEDGFLRLSLCLQTNGTLVDKEICTWLKRHNFRVGLSIDGPPNVHNNNRPFKIGHGSFEQVFDAYNLLNDARILDGIIATVFNPKFISDIFDFFIDSSITSFTINGAYASESATDEWQDDFASEHVKLANRIIEQNATGSCFIEKNIYNTVRSILTGHTNDSCRTSPCGAGNSIISIDTYGDLYPCDNFHGDKAWCYGNIRSFGMGNLKAMLKQSNIGSKLVNYCSESKARCKSCVALNSCGCGCVGSHSIITASKQALPHFCRYNKSFYDGIYSITSQNILNSVLLTKPDLLYES